MSQGRTYLESKYGLRTIAAENVHERFMYLAGDDKRRCDELFRALTDPKADGVLAIRGGYGCARIYPELIARLKKVPRLKPRIVAGYSDLTIVLNGLYQDLGWVTFHAPVLVGRPFRTPLPIEESTFEKCLLTAEPLGAITDEQMIVLNEGRARGPIVGGCLSLLVSSLGTSYEIETRGKVLFVEDVDEKPYRLDRMFTQLLHARKLDGVKALVIGQMAHCDPPAEAKDPSRTSALDAIKSAIGAHLERAKIPAVYNFPAGHGMPQITFPIGAMVEVRAKAEKPEVVFLEAGTE